MKCSTDRKLRIKFNEVDHDVNKSSFEILLNLLEKKKKEKNLESFRVVSNCTAWCERASDQVTSSSLIPFPIERSVMHEVFPSITCNTYLYTTYA